MSGHSSSNHVSYNQQHSTPNSQQRHPHHQNHASSRSTRGQAAQTFNQQQNDMRVPTFPIDPILGGPQNASGTTSSLATPTNQPLPSFQHHYNTRPQSGGDARQQYNSTPTSFPPEYVHHQQHQTPQTDYNNYDTSFG